MKRYFKIIIILILLVSFSSCKKKEDPPVVEKTIDEKINELTDIDINLSATNGVELSSFYITNIIAIVNPAISYPESEYNSLFKLEDWKIPQTNSKENEGDVTAIEVKNEPAKINLSSELMFEVKYTGDATNEPTKVLLKNINIEKSPMYGTLKFYAIVEGTEKDYLYKLKNNLINKEYEYKKDLLGKELKDGVLNLRFSSLIDNILSTDTSTLRKTNYKDLLKEKNINEESIKYTISFDIIIYTENNVFALPFKYEFKDISLSEENMYKIYNYNNPLYFNVIE